MRLKLQILLAVAIFLGAFNANAQYSERQFLMALNEELEDMNANLPLDLGGPSIMTETYLDIANKRVVNKYEIKQSDEAYLSVSLHSKEWLSKKAKEELLSLIKGNELLRRPYRYGVSARYIYYYNGKLAYSFDVTPNDVLR